MASAPEPRVDIAFLRRYQLEPSLEKVDILNCDTANTEDAAGLDVVGVWTTNHGLSASFDLSPAEATELATLCAAQWVMFIVRNKPVKSWELLAVLERASAFIDTKDKSIVAITNELCAKLEEARKPLSCTKCGNPTMYRGHSTLCVACEDEERGLDADTD